MARRSVKREIVRGWESGARGAEELRRFRPTGTPPPLIGVGVRFLCYFPSELPPPSRGMDVTRSVLVAFLVFCNSSCLMLFAMLMCESRCLVLGWVR